MKTSTKTLPDGSEETLTETSDIHSCEFSVNYKNEVGFVVKAYDQLSAKAVAEAEEMAKAALNIRADLRDRMADAAKAREADK